MSLEYQHAILAVARDADAAEMAIDGMDRCKEWLDGISAFGSELRIAALVGQCAHESAGFARLVESLRYSAERLIQVWPGRFRSEADAEPYAGNPEALAEMVYGGRRDLGNSEPGDGWRYRGRGWIQLTGRDNYRRIGRALGLDLEADPGQATDPRIAWMIAGHYLATRRRAGRSGFEWADAGDVEAVTRIINGGTHGLAERRRLTAQALEALDAA